MVEDVAVSLVVVVVVDDICILPLAMGQTIRTAQAEPGN